MGKANCNTADFNAHDPAQQISEDQAFAGTFEADLNTAEELVVVVEPPEGVFATMVVAESVESAQALAAANLLPGTARILATLSAEGLATLRLPELHQNGQNPSQDPGRVVFAPDGTPESRRAAHLAAHRAKAAGWTVDFLAAPEGSHWADVLAGRVSPPEEDLARIRDLFVPPPSSDFREDASGLADDIDNRLL